VFDGDTLHVFATVSATPTGEVRLLGTVCQAGLLEAGAITDIMSGDSLLGTALFHAVPESPKSLGNGLSRIAASTRLLETTDKKKKVRLALDYQLVTPLTNFLMEHIRADGEKATDMPVLQKVRQMAPAGHSGLGTVDYGTPSVMRSVSYSIKAPSTDIQFSKSSIDANYDIPAFLRRSDDAEIEKLKKQKVT
jgi:Ca-activated chloride channel family protein